jgi:nucleoside-diphosphate-sugar epimerase
MAPKLVLLTGASGFIGTRVQSLLLKSGYHIRILARKPDVKLSSIDCIVGDLLDTLVCQRATENVSIVIHAAGAKRDITRLWKVNVQGTENLLAAALCEGVERFVHISSVGVIGADPLNPKAFSEEVSCRPRNEYERSKWEAEKLVKHAGMKGLQVVILRPANVFGDADPEHGLLRLIGSVKNGWFVYLGGRHAICNYVFIDDVADACKILAEHPDAAGHIYNLSDDCTLGEFVDVIADELGVARPRFQIPDSMSILMRTGLRILQGYSSVSKFLIISRLISLNNQVKFITNRLADELGFRCPVGWRQGLSRIVRWYRSQGMV